MKELKKYWDIFKLDSQGAYTVEEIPAAKEFFHTQLSEFIQETSPDHRAIQNKLLELSDLGNGNQIEINFLPFTQILLDRAILLYYPCIMAEVCLRCCISYLIKEICLNLVNKFGSKYGFTLKELLSYVLDDTLQELKPSTSPSSSKKYIPVSIKILQTFKPERGSLSTWTERLVKTHKELSFFLEENGVYIKSDWAILNGTTTEKLEEILRDFYGYTGQQINQASFLLKNYHKVYKGDRIAARATKTASNKCPIPSTDQLDRIVKLLGYRIKSQDVLSKLEDLAQKLRKSCYKLVPLEDRDDDYSVLLEVEQRQLNQFNSDLINSDLEDKAKQKRKEFTQWSEEKLQHFLNKALEDNIQNKFPQDSSTKKTKKQQEQAEKFIKALWSYYYENKTMTEIANEMGIKQCNVSRLLKLPHFRDAVKVSIMHYFKSSIPHEVPKYFGLSLEDLKKRSQSISEFLNGKATKELEKAAQEASTSRELQKESTIFRETVLQILSQPKYETYLTNRKIKHEKQ